MFKKIMHILALSCKKATELIEKKSLFGLSRIEKIQLHIHTGMCGACKNYEDQSEKIDEILSEEAKYSPDELKESSSRAGSADLKSRIIKDLEKK